MSNPGPRKCFNSQTRETIAKVYDFLKQDATEILNLVSDPISNSNAVLISQLSDHLNCVRKRTAKAVGVSERSVTNILSERKETGTFKSPYKDRKKRVKKLELTKYNVDVIRSTIENYQIENYKLPTLIKLKRIFQDKLNYTGGISTLRTTLLKLGYKWETVVNKRVIVHGHIKKESKLINTEKAEEIVHNTGTSF